MKYIVVHTKTGMFFRERGYGLTDEVGCAFLYDWEEVALLLAPSSKGTYRVRQVKP